MMGVTNVYTVLVPAFCNDNVLVASGNIADKQLSKNLMLTTPFEPYFYCHCHIQTLTTRHSRSTLEIITKIKLLYMTLRPLSLLQVMLQISLHLIKPSAPSILKTKDYPLSSYDVLLPETLLHNKPQIKSKERAATKTK